MVYVHVHTEYLCNLCYVILFNQDLSPLSKTCIVAHSRDNTDERDEILSLSLELSLSLSLLHTNTHTLSLSIE